MVAVRPTQLEEVLRRAEQALTEEDAALIRAVFRSYVYVTGLVEDKNTSIRRLRQLLFGARTEKTDAVVGRTTENPDATGPSDTAATKAGAAGEPASGSSNAADCELVSRGHGRHGADAYRGAGWLPRPGRARPRSQGEPPARGLEACELLHPLCTPRSCVARPGACGTGQAVDPT
jgi:hypothetical protein